MNHFLQHHLLKRLSFPNPVIFTFFGQHWGLNSGLGTCKASALLLKSHLQFILLWLLLVMSQELFAQAGLEM
jgi:hypothetical protein